MIFKDNFKVVIKGLDTNRSRSFLTILGIVIGIAAIILIMSIGRGAENLILGQIRGLGSQTIFIEPGREPQGPSNFAELFTDSLKQKDVDALRINSNVQGIKELTPTVMQVLPVTFENETVRTNIIGSSDLMAKILEIYPTEGAYFTDDDIRQKESVAVIGAEVRRKLFNQSDALNEKIKIKGKTFRVVGVLPKKGQVALFNVDEMVAVPYTTAQQYLFGINHFNAIIVQAESEEIVPRVVRDIESTLRETHNIDDPDKDDFHIMTQKNVAERVQTVTSILTILLVSVAAISLIVGGIGIMNIMLVSVSERTREIGLRKAIGATDREIMTQFLFEAIMLTSIGGIIGILFGVTLSFIASVALSRAVSLGWEFTFPVSPAIIGVVVAAFVGLAFGLYPARQAAQKSPIEALRYE